MTMDKYEQEEFVFDAPASEASIDPSMPFESLPSLSKPKEDVETCWRSVKIVGILSFLAMIEGGLIGMGEWPYMQEIDHDVTVNFFGIATSVSRIGKISFTLVFSFWTYRTKTVRPPLIAGRILALIGCLLYLSVEFLPSGRRYLMLICYSFFAISGSSAIVLRIYLIAVSSVVDRPKAYACIALSATLSIVAGPSLQLAFSWIKYPGYTIFSNIHFNLYTAPVWVSIFLNVISLTIMHCFLEEKLATSNKIEFSQFNFSSLIILLRKLKKEDIPWNLVVLCWLEKMTVGLTMGSLMTISAPLKTAVFGWDGQKTVLVSSVSMIISGLLSLGVATVIVRTPIMKRVPSRTLFMAAISIIIFLYVGTYPLPGISISIPLYNATSGEGCNPAVYSWCTTARATHPAIFIAVSLAVIGIASPMIHISIDTIYSTILAKIDQSLMQGIIVVLEDIIAIIGPIYASEVFTSYGQAPLWIMNGLITATAAFLWLAHLMKLKLYH